MLFNKNIILEILQSDFGEQVDTMIESCVMDMEACDLDSILEYSADYALLDEIEEMTVTEYDAEEEYDQTSVRGILEVKAMITGYTHWDGEEIRVDDGIVTLGIGFCFDTDGTNHSNLQLEYVY